MVEINKIDNYNTLKDDIQYLINTAKNQAYKAVDNIRVQVYWQVGERVSREKLTFGKGSYGNSIIERLANDIKFKKRLLFEILQFYRVYPKVHALRAQLSWTHYNVLIRLREDKERQFYEEQTIANMWSSRELERRIREGTYRKSSLQLIKPSRELTDPSQIFKDSYNFDFLGLQKSEKDFESKLMLNSQKFLFELGNDFFIGENQKKIIIDGKFHYIDLLMFHRKLRCTILVDFKTGPFEADYVGQMNKYVSYFRENLQYPGERDAIGLILVNNKGVEEVHYALAGLDEDIFVREYKIHLPKEGIIKRGLNENKRNSFRAKAKRAVKDKRA